MELLKRLAAYAIPILTVLGTGQWNPFPVSSPWHEVVAPLATALATWIAFRVHPNGVNGPAAAQPPTFPALSQGGFAQMRFIMALILSCSMSLFACAYLRRLTASDIKAADVSVQVGDENIRVTAADGQACVTSTLFLPVKAIGLECQTACGQRSSDGTKLLVACRAIGTVGPVVPISIPVPL